MVIRRITPNALRNTSPDPFLRQNARFSKNYFRALNRYCSANITEKESKGDSI
jgi:hypothetical protein